MNLRAAYAPFKAELDGCLCATCNATGAAVHTIRLGMLRAGEHRRVTLAERAADAREIRDNRLTHLQTTGAPESLIEAVERGYVKTPSYMAIGIGVGMTPTVGRPRPTAQVVPLDTGRTTAPARTAA